jgi:hypothetical protein
MKNDENLLNVLRAADSVKLSMLSRFVTGVSRQTHSISEYFTLQMQLPLLLPNVKQVCNCFNTLG